MRWVRRSGEQLGPPADTFAEVFMKKVLGLMATVSLLVWALGCASSKQLGPLNGGTGGGGGNSATMASGNWSFTTSGGTNGPLFMGGQLNASGTSISGNLIVVGQQGSGFTISSASSPMAVTGSTSNGTITMTGVIASSTITITFTGQSGSGLTTLDGGTYTVAGGTDAGDAGTVSGAIASDFSGTWQGSEPLTAGVMTVQFTESTTPNTTPSRIGTFALTGSGTGVTFSGVTGCAVTGTLDPALSFTAGSIVYMKIDTIDQTVPGHLIFLGFADSPTTPTTLSGGGYIYGGGSSCMLQNDSFQHPISLTKQ